MITLTTGPGVRGTILLNEDMCLGVILKRIKHLMIIHVRFDSHEEIFL